VLAQLINEACAFAIGSGRPRRGGNNRAHVEKNIRADSGKPRALVGEGSHYPDRAEIYRAPLRQRPGVKKPPSSSKSRLNLRQGRFLAEYLQSHNATKAAIKAGHSPRTAYSQGHDLLKKPEIATAINEALDASAVTAERVVQEAAAIAFLNPQDFYDANGEFLPVKDMPERAARALTGMEVETVFERNVAGKMVPTGALRRKIRFAAKVPALDLLAKHLGLYQRPSAPAAAASGFTIVLHGLNNDETPRK
jgi:phage terminase small subunit